MGTTTQKLHAILDSKSAIKSAIETRGVSGVGDVLSSYPQKILDIRDSRCGIDLDALFVLTDNGTGIGREETKKWRFDATGITHLEEGALQDRFIFNNEISSVYFPDLSSISNKALFRSFMYSQ